MACPNCGSEQVVWDDSCSFSWELLDFINWQGGDGVRTMQVVVCTIDYCPFCGEQLLSPSEVCARGCDG
jgi:predicted RNA-binding Zn-ribbon protein involved in translation (DUF1610 family)